MADNFADRLLDAVTSKEAPVCVGIDPVLEKLPNEIRADRRFNDPNDSEIAVDAVLEFCRNVIRAVSPYVPAVKINSAYFERFHGVGVTAYYDLVEEAAAHDLIVIGDVKRGDVGHTAELYAQAHLATPRFDDLQSTLTPDAVTLSPYLGRDAVQPFLDVAREEAKGVFVLVRTTNPSAGSIQDFADANGRTLADHVADLVAEWANDESLIGKQGYSAVGAVVSAGDPSIAANLRKRMPRSLFLVPGYGVQGAKADQVRACFQPDGSGAIVSASRSIIYAFADPQYRTQFTDDWTKCVEQACKDFIDEVRKILPTRTG